MKEVLIQAITEMGCVVYTSVNVNENYTMIEMVEAVKSMGYVQFRIVETMKRFAKVGQ